MQSRHHNYVRTCKHVWHLCIVIDMANERHVPSYAHLLCSLEKPVAQWTRATYYEPKIAARVFPESKTELRNDKHASSSYEVPRNQNYGCRIRAEVISSNIRVK